MTSNNPAVLVAALEAEFALTELLSALERSPTWSGNLCSLRNVLQNLREAMALPTCPTDWQWFHISHPDIEEIKATGTRIMVFVPRKVMLTGASKQHSQFYEAKLVLAHWAQLPAPTRAVTPSKLAVELQEKHGGYWAADRRGIKPVIGSPQLWCHLPKIEGLPGLL